MRITKKAMSHIEMILSFVIFVGFLIFIIAIFNPFKDASPNRLYLDMLERNIKENAKTELIFLTTGLDINPANIPNYPGCFFFVYNLSKISVKNSDNNHVESLTRVISGNNRIFIKSNRDFYYIYSSEEFKEDNFEYSNCMALSAADYKLGLFRKYDFISNNSMVNMEKEYYDNYELLKEKLQIPADMEFAFSAKTNDAIFAKAENKNAGKRAVARELPIEIVYADGEFKTGVLNIKIWKE